MAEAQLGWWLGSLVGAATDPVILVYALAVVALSNTLRHFVLWAVLGGAGVSLCVSSMTYGFAQRVEPGISFLAWAMPRLPVRVIAVVIVAGAGFSIKAAAKRIGRSQSAE